MRRRDRRSFDPQRVLAAAVEAYLDGGEPRARGAAAEERHARRRIGGGAVVLGIGIGIGARSLYRRARELDLERVARAVEKRMVN